MVNMVALSLNHFLINKNMKIKIKWLEMVNFKGAENKRIEFNDNTTLRGENKTGKSTVVDSIYWCLFGKNSEDNAKFGVKTYDSNYNIIPNLDHSVTLSLDINGTEEVFTRRLVEKWVKPHGETERIYQGDETKFEINGVPKQKKEFDLEIGNIISPVLFKLISSPLEFNRLHWEKRREALISMVGSISNTDVFAKNNAQLSEQLIQAIETGEFEKYKSEVIAKSKPLREQLKEIPTRISEVKNSLPVVLDWSTLMAQISTKKNRILEIDTELQNVSKKHENEAKKQTELVKLIGEKQIELQNIENEAKTELNKDLIKLKKEHQELNENLIKLKEVVETNNKFINKSNEQLLQLESERTVLIEQWKNIKSRVFELKEHETICPTCKRELENIQEISAEMEGNFNVKKANDLDLNVKLGKEKANEIETLKKQIQEAIEVVENIETQIPEVEKALEAVDLTEKPVDLSMNKEWNDCFNEIEALKQKQQEKPVEGIDAHNSEKRILSEEIEMLQKDLNKKEQIDISEKRIQELTQKQKTLSQEIANMEKEENAILGFEKAKMEALEEKVNGLFSYVKFKMFEPQKNGGEKPDCITLIDGVPYSDANTASKINAGVDICNVLQKHHGIEVPVIVDNRESVSELLPVQGQLINLFKDHNYKTLTVE